MADARRSEEIQRAFLPDAVKATNVAWAERTERQAIAAEQAEFSVLAKRDILAALNDGAAVLAGFLYRDHNGDGAYTPGEQLTATLLGLPQLAGPDAPEVTSYANCFWFGPLKPGGSYTLTYDVEGAESVSQTVTAGPGLNLCHVPVRPTKPLIYIVPHSHFDPEWRNTYQSYLLHELPHLIERVELLREQPEHCFNLDEECVLRPLIDRHPEIVDELRQRILEGVFEPKGVVTAGELTMPLGESMIRQMTEGEQLISRMLGMTVRPSIFWNIDCYGINFQLPQILAKAGRTYCVIGEYVKIGYAHSDGREVKADELPFSNFEVWDHPEFWLEGLDGSKVLVHRSNYGTESPGPQVALDRLLSHQSAFNFQGGDFAKAERKLPDFVREINDPKRAAKYDGKKHAWGWPILGAPGGACVHILATSEQFFRAVERDPGLPTLRTESRIGFWTGSYESRARSRQSSRRTECLLLSAEAVSSAARVAGLPGALEDLREAWYMLLISHHHDPQLTIMGPGQIHEVIQRNLDAGRWAQRVVDRAATYLSGRIATDARPGRAVVVFNSLGWGRSSVVSLDAEEGEAGPVRVVDPAGKAAAAQVVTDEDGRASVAFLAEDVPAGGWRTYYVQAGEGPGSQLTASEKALENEHVRVELADGVVRKIIEKSTGQPLFAANATAAVNEVFIWEDEGCIAQIRPVDFMDSAKLVARSSQVDRRVRVVESGPARAAVEVVFAMDWGAFRQRIALQAGAPWVDFETHVDWRAAPEGGRRVRVAFPSVLKDAKVWRDIPFAVLPWEQSDAIQPINSWMGLSDAEGAVGAALIHDGPCSQQTRNDVLWQTLFRSIRMPGAIEDDKPDSCGWDLSGDTALEEGPNTYRQRLVVYAGSWQDAAMPRQSLAFTTPMVAQPADRHGGELAGERMLLAVEPRDLVPCAWKQSDFTDAALVRVYNPTDKELDGTLHVGFDVAAADETDFREEHTGDLTARDGRIELHLGPYAIKTIRLTTA